MTDQQIARGRRAVACPGWRVMCGMWMRRIVPGGCDLGLCRVTEDNIHADWSGYMPILDDPATLGCLMALAREALGEPGAHAVKYAYHWGIERHDSYSEGPQALRHDGAWDATWCADAVSGLDEPEAWLAALEAAGRR